MSERFSKDAHTHPVGPPDVSQRRVTVKGEGDS